MIDVVGVVAVVQRERPGAFALGMWKRLLFQTRSAALATGSAATF